MQKFKYGLFGSDPEKNPFQQIDISDIEVVEKDSVKAEQDRLENIIKDICHLELSAFVVKQDDEKYKVVVKIKNTDIQTVTIKIPAFSYEQTIKNSGILANAPKPTEEVVNRYLEVAELDENGNHLSHLEGGIPFTPPPALPNFTLVDFGQGGTAHGTLLKNILAVACLVWKIGHRLP